MNSTRISIARILEADVSLTWQEAVAVVQEIAMVSDVETAMNGTPPLVTPATCFLTTAGDVDLPETATDERPGAVADLLRDVLRGCDAPAALLALAGRHPDDLFGELAAFSSGPRRPIIAELAGRVLGPTPVARGDVDAIRRSRPDAPTPRAEASHRRWTPMTPPKAVAPPIVVSVPAQPTVTAAPAQAAVVGPPPVAVAAPRPAATSPPPPQTGPVPAARALLASTPPEPRTAAPISGVQVVDLQPLATVSGELQRLRLKIANAAARGQRSGFPQAPRAAWIAGGALAAGVLAALLWWAGMDTPPVLEAKRTGIVPGWPFAAAVAPVSPAAYTTTPTPANTTSRMLPLLQASTAVEPLWTPMTNAPPLDVNAGATGVEAPPLRGDVPRIELGSIASATAPSLAERATAKDGPLPVSGATTERPAAPVSAGRGRPFSEEAFSAGDADVAPPKLRRQQLPTAVLEPGTVVPEGWPFLTVVVDETGVVESVRLVASAPAPGQSLYRHRMLLAAAKAWQFRPARKDGQPVRYAIQVPLEP